MRRILASTLFLLFGCVSAAVKEDLVPYLPYMATFDFNLYSGYLPVTGSGKALHYMLAESQNNPSTDPLQIWFNGGPGCSSLLGFLQEHGPYVMDDETNFFFENPYSWNREVNMLYIEMPGGVGFSKCDQVRCSYDDDSTADDNLAAMLEFFILYPEYAKHDLFISGESYAGVYVPYLAYRMYTNNQDENRNFTFNLKGILVGNGVTNWRWDGDPALVKIGYNFGLYGSEIQNELTANDCNYYYLDVGQGNSTPKCDALFVKFRKLMNNLNVYDLYRRCYDAGEPLNRTSMMGSSKVGDEIKTYRKYYEAAEYTPWLFSKHNSHLLEDSTNNSMGACTFGVPMSEFINDEEVRHLLHIPDEIQAWEQCSSKIGYSSGEKASQWIYPILRDAGYRILFYSGDTDGAVPTWGSIMWLKDIGWPITETKRPYLYNGQVAGYKEEYEGLTFATIHGTGHMAPQWKRAETYYLIFNWLFNREL